MNATTKALLDLQQEEFHDGDTVEPETVDRLRSKLPIQVLHEYDYRKRRFGVDSVVAIENGICTGCRVGVSQRTERLAHNRLTECEHCGRLVYNPKKRRRIRLEVCAA